tara:strand:- start:1196 stop:1480 length:285 start_codon:yes stop_codon:yes gene_type:complete
MSIKNNMSQINTQLQANNFISYNIISLIRDELPADQKKLFLELPHMKEVYVTILYNLLKADLESLSLIRTCDYNSLKELHKMIVGMLPDWEENN